MAAESEGPYFVYSRDGEKLAGPIKGLLEATARAKSVGKGAYVEDPKGKAAWKPKGES